MLSFLMDMAMSTGNRIFSLLFICYLERYLDIFFVFISLVQFCFEEDIKILPETKQVSFIFPIQNFL